MRHVKIREGRHLHTTNFTITDCFVQSRSIIIFTKLRKFHEFLFELRIMARIRQCNQKHPWEMHNLGRPTFLWQRATPLVAGVSLPARGKKNSMWYTYLYSTKQSLSWERKGSPDIQDVPLILRKPKVHYHIYKSPPFVPILSQIYPAHASSQLHFSSIPVPYITV
jgi:hypothetical protein